ncbi:MAG: T9SS type A sorting domain-containing protein [Flavobacteriales bacterium]|nr:T9SS type A sorting domain-containing protein [Flavobacteriales bacterium]
MYKVFVIIGIVLSCSSGFAQSLYYTPASDDAILEASTNTGNGDINRIDNNYEIYPNPISAFFELTTGHSELVKIKISNSRGQQMHESVIRERALINCSTWSKGTYTIKLYRDGEVETKEFKITF